jgi:hypothetical protein
MVTVMHPADFAELNTELRKGNGLWLLHRASHGGWVLGGLRIQQDQYLEPGQMKFRYEIDI